MIFLSVETNPNDLNKLNSQNTL